MKKSLLLTALSLAFAGSVFALTPPAVTTPGSAAAPAPAAAVTPAATLATDLPTTPATVNGVCKDGSAFSAASTKGACQGHGGIDKKAAAPSGAPAASATAPVAANATATGKPTAKTDPSQMAQAPGGGAGQVWANNSSKVYHCLGAKYYGKTKHGEYMTEANAKAKGFHGDNGKVCT